MSHSHADPKRPSGASRLHSSADFSRAGPSDVHLRVNEMNRDSLVTDGCLSCGVRHRSPPRMMFRWAVPEWYVLGAAAFWGAFLLLSAQAPEFMWYHSARQEQVYRAVVLLATNWSITLPFLYLLVVAAGSLLFLRRSNVSQCHTCRETHHGATSALRRRVVIGAVVVTLSSYLLMTTFELPLALAGLVLIPFALASIHFARSFRRDQRLTFLPVSEGILTVGGGSALEDVLRLERPALLSPKAPGRWWAAAAIAATCLGLATSLVTHVAQDSLTCPPGTRLSSVNTPDGDVREWCEFPDGTWHGRYLRTGVDGKVLVVGGFYDGSPSGTWIDYSTWSSGRLLDEFDVVDKLSSDLMR